MKKFLNWLAAFFTPKPLTAEEQYDVELVRALRRDFDQERKDAAQKKRDDRADRQRRIAARGKGHD